LGGDGADVFLIQPALNAKRDILLKHQNADRTIDWKRVAGENGEVHDHWPESVGTDWIVDFDPTEGDVILIDGHTADIERKGSVDHRDVNGDGVMDTVLTIRSNQPNGGAHDKDLMGKVVVLSHRLDAGDVEVNAKSFAGIIDTVEELDEALFAEGVRDDDPDREASINPFLDLLPGDVAALAAPATPVYEETIRARALVDAPDDDVDGTNGDDVLHGDAPAGGHGHGGHGGHGAHGAMAGMPMPMPAPISFFSFEDFEDGVFADGRGVSDLGYYEAKDRAALLQTDLADVPTEAGSPGDGGRAIRFEDDDQFAVVAHDEAYETLQGTVALWFKPDAVDGHPQTLVAKDERNAGEGGHMRIEIRDGGKLLVRLSPGDGGGNREWLSHFNLAEAGEWAHVAVSWGESGATVFWNGEALNDRDFMALQGHTPLSGYKEHFQMENTRAWVLGADTGHANDADSAATLAADDRLRSEFEGAIDGFGVWGGLSAADALSAAHVEQLYENGPGDLSRAARQDAPVEVGDDDLRGWGGDDDLYGGAGRDVLDGGDGNDGLFGGYGADLGLGGAGRDLIELGHGNDTGYGGDGNDVLLSRGYGREGPVYFDADRDEGDPYAELSPVNGQVYESQPIPDDDHYWGGAGADTLRIETLINAKERFLLDHVMEDGHIHWHGVAGENDNVHDHWVDRFGHDVWWDYDEDEGDRIQIVGHTTRVLEVEQIHDEGTGERLFSRIHVYSDQGKNGGAHNDDRLGILDVYGSEVSEKDIYENAGPAYGIVHSIHELEEAVTPLYASDETARQGLRAAGAPQEMAEAPEPAPMPMPMPMPEPAPMPMPAPMAMPPSAEEPTPPQPAPQPAPPAPSAEAEEEEAALPPSPPPSSPPPAPEGPEAPRETVEIALAADPDDDADLRGDRAGDAMAGAEGDDKLRGRGGDDDLFGGDGDDALRGDRGADRLYGGEGEDRLKGGAGDDFLFGGLDDDRLAGGSRADALFGGEDDDDLKGGGGGDLLVGGLGEDDLIGGGGLDVAVFEGAMEDYAVSVARRRRVEIESFETGEIDALRGVEQIRFLGSGVTYSVARRGLEEMTGDGAFDQAAYDRLAKMAETEFLFVDGAGDPLFG
ncbi:MAG: LamG-like jellyroll fold domain-containing protein, partial [Pseudomonadota bacterium]